MIDAMPIKANVIVGANNEAHVVPDMIFVKLVKAQEFGVIIEIFRMRLGNTEMGSMDPPKRAKSCTPIPPSVSAIFSLEVKAATTIDSPDTAKLYIKAMKMVWRALFPQPTFNTK